MFLSLAVISENRRLKGVWREYFWETLEDSAVFLNHRYLEGSVLPNIVILLTWQVSVNT